MWKKCVIGIFIMAVCALALKTFAEGTVWSAEPVDPKADQILQRMSQYLISARQFKFEAYKTVDVVLDSGQMIQLSDTTKISVSRPDKILAQSTGDTNNEHVWYDGKNLSVLSPEQNNYATVDVPNTIDEMMDYVVETIRSRNTLSRLSHQRSIQICDTTRAVGDLPGPALRSRSQMPPFGISAGGL